MTSTATTARPINNYRRQFFAFCCPDHFEPINSTNSLVNKDKRCSGSFFFAFNFLYVRWRFEVYHLVIACARRMDAFSLVFNYRRSFGRLNRCGFTTKYFFLFVARDSHVYNSLSSMCCRLVCRSGEWLWLTLVSPFEWRCRTVNERYFTIRSSIATNNYFSNWWKFQVLIFHCHFKVVYALVSLVRLDRFVAMKIRLICRCIVDETNAWPSPKHCLSSILFLFFYFWF